MKIVESLTTQVFSTFSELSHQLTQHDSADDIDSDPDTYALPSNIHPLLFHIIVNSNMNSLDSIISIRSLMIMLR